MLSETEQGGTLSTIQQNQMQHDYQLICLAPLLDERCKDGPHDFIGALLGSFGLQVHVQQIPDPLHGDVVVVVVKWSKGILQDITGMGEEDQGQDSLVHSMRIVDPL